MTDKAKRSLIILATLIPVVGARAQSAPQIPSSNTPSSAAPAAAGAAAPAPAAPAAGTTTSGGAAAPSGSGGSETILTIDSLPASPDFLIREIDRDTAPRGSTTPSTRPLEVPNFESEVGTSRWARSSFGGYLGIGNATVVNTPFRITRDEALVGQGTEFGVGLGVLLDFGLPGAQDEAYRLKVGLQRQSLSPPADSEVTYETGQLETSATVLDISLLYRYYLPYLAELADLWVGVGGALDYALSTSRPGAETVVPLSHVRNTYGLRLIGAIGADIPVSGIHDIAVELNWSFLKGYALFMGFKTSL